MTYYYFTNELYHHGIKGMRWGVRRFQNEDGTLTEAGRQRYGIEQLEKAARKKAYKERRKNGGSALFRSARLSTGKNYDEAEKNFEKKVLNDSKYKELSNKAKEAEKKRLLMEKDVVGDEAGYEKLIRSQEYRDATKESRNITREKEKRVDQLARKYYETIKDAKLSDLRIQEKDKELVRKYLSGKFNYYVWDKNLEYNPDNSYEWLDQKYLD